MVCSLSFKATNSKPEDLYTYYFTCMNNFMCFTTIFKIPISEIAFLRNNLHVKLIIVCLKKGVSFKSRGRIDFVANDNKIMID